MQGDLTQQPLVKRVLLPAVPATYVGAAVEIKSGKNLVLLLKTKISACNGTASKISSLKFTGSPENEAFAQGMRLYQQTEGKRVGLHYLLPCTSRTLRHMHSQQQMDLQDGAMNDFLGSLPKDLYARYYLYTKTNGRYAPDRQHHSTKQFNT
jgi:hypothetical protein